MNMIVNATKVHIIAFVTLVLLGSSANAWADSDVFKTLDHAAFSAISSNASTLVIDVRTVEEFAEGHVPGAINIPLASVPDNLGAFGEMQTPIVMYCRSGRRAAEALEILSNAGFNNLYHLDGDIMGWEEAGNAMEFPAKTATN
jgi:rhodanese-related sulfurtransferase